MRKVKDAVDLTTKEKIYFKGHAKATYLSDGRNVEDALAEIPSGESSMFEAIYGETPFADLWNAHQSNKHVVVRSGKFVLSLVRADETLISFSAINNENVYSATCNSSNVWTQGAVFQVEKATNKVTSLSDKSTDTQYPSAKAVYNAIKQSGGQGGGEPSQYIKDATTSEDGNTLTLTKKDNTKVVFSPSGGGTGGGVSKEHYYDITILDQVYRVKDACANSRYVVVGALKGISLYDRLTNTQIVSDWTTNIAAVKLTSEGVYVLRGNLLEVRDFNLTILHTVDLGHSDFDKVTFTDNECYAVIDGALTRINATSEPQIVAGYESNVVFVKHAYNVGTSIVMLDSSDNKYYLSILEYTAYKSPVPNQSLVYVGTTDGNVLVKTAINTLGIISNQLILGRLYNETFSDIKIALTPLTQLLIIKSCSVIEGIIFSVATTKNFISDKVAIMNNTIYNISNPDLTSHTLCAVLGQAGNGLVTRIKVIDL